MVKLFLSYYKNHIGLLILDSTAAVFVSGLGILLPIFVRQIIDIHIANKDMQMILILGFILIFAYLLKMLGDYIINFYGHMMGTRIERDMRIDLFKKIQTFDTEFFDETKTGKLMSYIVSHLRDISEMSHHAPENILLASIMLIGSFIYLSTIHILFTVVMYVLLLVLIIFSYYRREKMLNASRRTRTTHEEINAGTENALGGIRLTKAFTNEHHEINKFKNVSYKYQESFSSFYKQMAIFSSGNGLIIDLIYVAIIVLGGYLLINNQLQTGEFMAFFFALTFILTPIRLIISTIEQINAGWSGYEKFYELMNVSPNIVSKNKTKDFPVFKTLSFNNVWFKYNKSDRWVLKDFNLDIRKGQKIALVGETGVGKSTISKLIPRFYDISKGSILFNDVNIKDVDITELRSYIGHVQQDVYIFFGTIKDNIQYGRPNATDEDIVEAAKKANIHDFIISLENGYDTLVGERGVKLSGGQKQRISIARVFLKDPPVLILDEATSSLDNITERLIQKAIDNLSKGRTTIVIAHRLSTIQNSDEIIVLDEKGIKERGTHQQLLDHKGYYYHLHAATQ
jgi:ATP-binding cassette subfamily B protein